MCCNANGDYLPLYVIYKATLLRESWTKNGPSQCRYNCSESGWMESVHFVEWFDKIFIEYVKELDGPKLLVFDGHTSHISIELIELARENDVHLLCLPAHSSHVLQPLDVSVYKPLKTKWKQLLDEFYLSGNSIVSKELFPSLLEQVREKALTRTNAVSGFEATGKVKSS